MIIIKYHKIIHSYNAVMMAISHPSHPSHPPSLAHLRCREESIKDLLRPKGLLCGILGAAEAHHDVGEPRFQRKKHGKNPRVNSRSITFGIQKRQKLVKTHRYSESEWLGKNIMMIWVAPGNQCLESKALHLLCLLVSGPNIWDGHRSCGILLFGM